MKFISNIKFKEYFIISLITFILIETILQISIRKGIIKIHNILNFTNISEKEFNEYLKFRDNDLGWPSKLAHGKLFNKYGYRNIPNTNRNRDNKACISIFGDSQGYGLEVTDKQSWSNVLSNILDCKVENYSVPAYGTDQAFLRFRKIMPNSEYILMTFIDDNLRRNFIQFWDLEFGKIYIERTKPRFMIINNKLKLKKLPINNYNQMKKINNFDFSDVMKYETFVPNSKIYKTAYKLPRFSYTYSLIKISLKNVLTTYKNTNFIKKTFLYRFTDTRERFQTSSSKSIKLQVEILKKYINLCNQENKKCLILRLSMDFVNPEKERVNSIANAIENDPSLTSKVISGNFMARCIKDNLINQGVNKNKLDIRMDGGHYGVETNKAIGECLSEELKPVLFKN